MLKDSRDNKSAASMESQEINAKSKPEKQNFDSMFDTFQKSPEGFNKARVLTRSMKKIKSLMLIDGMINKNKKSKVDIVEMLPPQYDHLFGKGEAFDISPEEEIKYVQGQNLETIKD